MTEITITKDYIELEGHTEPIVCSSISTMIQFIIRLHNLDYDITGSIVSKVYKVPSKTLDTFRQLIKELETQYPDNVNVKEQ
jgi:uncharacterized protein YsxB (DUF464 family)